MAANNLSNIHVSPKVILTLILLQQENLRKLQQFCMASPEVVVRTCSVEKLLLNATQNSKENTRVGVSS